MTAATATPASDQVPEHLPVALWRRYKWHRQRSERPHMAASVALDDCGYTSQRKREPLRELLTARERDSGLASTEAERDAELALEAAELEAGGAVVAAEPEPGSVEAARADAHRRLAELEDQRRRLSPEALADNAVRTEVADIESEIAAARAVAGLADEAEPEIQRRQREAAEQAERELRERENAAAATLAPAVAKAKVAVDRSLAAAAAEVAKLCELQERQTAHLTAGGLDSFSARGVRFRADSVESAIRFHFRGVGLFSRVAGRDEALAPEGE